MKRLNCTRLALLLLILVLGLGACGDDIYYTDDYCVTAMKSYVIKYGRKSMKLIMIRSTVCINWNLLQTEVDRKDLNIIGWGSRFLRVL